MRKRLLRILWITPVAIVAIAIFIAIGGGTVMLLWNWLTPRLFGWPLITFWQALGLLVLCRILFGGWTSGGRRSRIRERVDERIRERMAERWEKMTPEEREKCSQTMRGRWGSFPPPDSKPTP